MTNENNNNNSFIKNIVASAIQLGLLGFIVFIVSSVVGILVPVVEYGYELGHSILGT